MDWSNWNIYIVLAILVAVVILILWYRCPTENYQRLPGRPDSQRFLAPDPVLSPVNLSTFCSIPSNITTKWGCNFDTTIYNVKDVHFKLSYTGSDGDEIFINDNITDDADGLTIDNAGADFHYSYEYSLSGILPDYYTLKIESFVPNVPEATVRHCSTCTQDLTLLPSQYDPVPSIEVDNTTYYYGLEGSGMINVSWEDTSIPYPLTGNQTFYNLSLQDSSGSIVEGTSVMLDYGQTSYQYDPNNVGTGSGLAVIYVTQNSDPGICTLDSSNTVSGSFDIVSFSTPTLTVNSGGDYCTTDTNFQVVWKVDCSGYVGPASCPGDFDYSVHISDSDSGFDLFFDQIYLGSGSICDQNQPSYCGTLSSTNGTYTFTVNMLPVGTYAQTVSMFLPNPGAGDSNEEVSSTAPDPAEVKDPSNGSSQSARNVKADASTYAFSDIITCTWDDPTDTDYTYTYKVSLVDSNDNVVSESDCDITPGQHSYTYTIFKFATTPGCGDPSGMDIQLTEGDTYKVKITTTASISGAWCVEDGTFTSDSYSGEFNIVECIDNGDCATSETDLLSDPYARMKYELQCTYADDVEACMANVSGSGGPTYQMDSREIPSTCQAKSGGGAKTCARSICPPMSAPYTPKSTTYAGCTAPYNDQYPNNPANSSFQSGGYFSYNDKVTSTAASYYADPFNTTNQFSYGYPFIAIIEGGTASEPEPVFTKEYQIDLSDTSQIVAVPGMTGYEDSGNDGDPSIFIMPVPIQNFHPFMAWNTFSEIDDDNNPAGGSKLMTYGNHCSGYGYNLYHVGSSTYLNNATDKCHSTGSDEGKLCTARMDVMTYINYYTDSTTGNRITCSKQPSADDDSTRNSCFTSNIWLDETNALFTDSKNSDVTISDTSPEHNGTCSGTNTDYSEASNNWNAPVANGKDKQGMIFFGSDTQSIGKLYHRDDNGENKISHMRRWVIDQNNNYFWTSGLGAGMDYSGTDGKEAVYQALAAQWPNGPPYSGSIQRPLDIRFSAPIQYGIAPMNQGNFYLEAYSWDSSYSVFSGLGFISGDTGGLLTAGYLNTPTPFPWIWAISCDIDNDGECNQYYEKDITNMNTTINGTPYYLGFSSGNTTRLVFGLNKYSADQPPSGTSSGTIKFWPSGYVYFHADSNDLDYWLCVDNTTSELVWINMNGASPGYPNDFTPLMLAMSWES